MCVILTDVCATHNSSFPCALCVCPPQDHWRRGLLDGWTKLSHSNRMLLQMLAAETTKTPEAMKILLRVLLHAVRKSINKDRRFWTTHVSKNVTHVSGWLPLMLRLHVLHRVSGRAHAGVIFKVDDKTTYRAGTTSDMSFAKVSDLARFAHALRSARPPRTLSQYHAIVSNLSQIGALLPDIGCLGMADTYGFLWATRATLIAEMRAAGVERLQVDYKRMRMHTFRKVFPDMAGWATRLTRLATQSTGPPTVAALVKHVGWKGPLELLTCVLCVLCKESALELPANIVRSLRDDIQEMRVEFRRAHTYEAHPLYILDAVCAKDTAEE